MRPFSAIAVAIAVAAVSASADDFDRFHGVLEMAQCQGEAVDNLLVLSERGPILFDTQREFREMIWKNWTAFETWDLSGREGTELAEYLIWGVFMGHWTTDEAKGFLAAFTACDGVSE